MTWDNIQWGAFPDYLQVAAIAIAAALLRYEFNKRRSEEFEKRKQYANLVGASAKRPEGKPVTLTYTNGSPAPMFNVYIKVHYIDGDEEGTHSESIGVLHPGTYVGHAHRRGV